MISSSSSYSSFIIFSFVILSTFSALIQYSTSIPCFKSIISFGDSLADTGNLVRLSSPQKTPGCAFPPYGETFFHHPTGRCSDGRLVIDFIAQHLGLPLVVPYAVAAESDPSENYEIFKKGVNFAVASATAMDNEFFEERGIHNKYTNVSLGTQLGWFKDLLPTICKNPSECSELLQNALFLMGEIGGNDYNHPLLEGSIEEMRSFVPLVIDVIVSAINELIEMGAATIMVPGNLPLGCSAIYLSYFMSTSNPEDFEPETGCLIWLNEFVNYHNEMLQTELKRIQKLDPRVNIIYADYYNVAMTIHRDPTKYGFGGGAHTACCGAGGGLYNVNISAMCGTPPSTACEDPSSYVSWDGHHLTEAAYSVISKGLLQGSYTIPPINISSCLSLPPLSTEKQFIQ